jgi:DNA-binding transcriptional ArsR family regulator
MIQDEYLRVWWWLLLGSRGGYTRARIIRALMEKPMNKHQLSRELGLNYKTVEHHIRILVEHHIVEPSSPGRYGSVFYIHRVAMARIRDLEELVRRALGEE